MKNVALMSFSFNFCRRVVENLEGPSSNVRAIVLGSVHVVMTEPKGRFAIGMFVGVEELGVVVDFGDADTLGGVRGAAFINIAALNSGIERTMLGR